MHVAKLEWRFTTRMKNYRMMTLNDALEHSGRAIPFKSAHHRNGIPVTYGKLPEIDYISAKKADLENAINIVSRMRASELYSKEKRNDNDLKNRQPAGVQISSFMNRLGDDGRNENAAPIDSAAQMKSAPPSADQFKKNDAQVSQQKPQKTDAEIKESIKKAESINKKIGATMTTDVPTDVLMKSVIDELF